MRVLAPPLALADTYSADDITAELAHARSPSMFQRHSIDELPPVGSSPRANHAWLLRAIEALAPKGQRVLIFGSIDPRVECLCLAAGAAHVTTVDYNQLSFDHPSLSTITVTELAALPPAALRFDVRACRTGVARSAPRWVVAVQAAQTSCRAHATHTMPHRPRCGRLLSRSPPLTTTGSGATVIGCTRTATCWRCAARGVRCGLADGS